MVQCWFNAQAEEFYLGGISKLVNRWQKCIALEVIVMLKNNNL